MTGQLDKWEIVMGFPQYPSQLQQLFLVSILTGFEACPGAKENLGEKPIRISILGKKNRQDIADGKKQPVTIW